MKLFVFFFVFFTSSAYADMDVWSEGIHLYAGVGANSSVYHTGGDTLGAGLHFKTDFGYSFGNKWAVEAGSFVKFTRVHETLIWDTLLTIGVRRKLAEDFYVRPFIGQAPTVFYTDKTPEVYRRSDSSRIIYTGPAFGVSFGRIYKSWFWETTVSYQSLDKGRGIRDSNTAPEEVFRSDLEGLKITSFSITFGLQVL
jgi:hypothetical protein